VQHATRRRWLVLVGCLAAVILGVLTVAAIKFRAGASGDRGSPGRRINRQEIKFRAGAPGDRPRDDGAHHVFAGGDIQSTLEAAAQDAVWKHVKVHAGTYRPRRYGHALIWFNQRHDGITLEAIGKVILTGSNPELADRDEEGYPAMVNHVVYFGDGITRRTVLRGFQITGANNFVSFEDEGSEIQPEIDAPNLNKEQFFYSDGGGIKIFGRSYPMIEDVEVHDNFSSPCGAGVSIEHRGYMHDSVMLRNCIFRDNRCPVTGSAVDLLQGSSAIIENCLFVGNLSNCPMDDYWSIREGKYKPQHGTGALTVFPQSKVVIRRCTFTGNRNGVDDSSQGNVYEDSIFWMNNVKGGWPTGSRYELDIQDAAQVRRCFVQGDTVDLNGTLDAENNFLACPDPHFDELFQPQSEQFEGVGYRPVADETR